ncbi:MAG: hypothetical protein R2688_08305 [Fimbriimonadaceae bacterium]
MQLGSQAETLEIDESPECERHTFLFSRWERLPYSSMVCREVKTDSGETMLLLFEP